MDIAFRRSAEATTLVPSGPIDGTTSQALQDALMAVVAEGPPSVILDLTLVPYVSSAGLRVLVITTKELKPRGQRLRLVNVQGEVLQVLKMANFTSFMDIA